MIHLQVLRRPRTQSIGMAEDKEICLSDRLRYQSVIGKRVVLDRSAGEIVEELVFVPASVQTVGELLEVSIEMLMTNAAEGSLQPGLEVGDVWAQGKTSPADSGVTSVVAS